MSAARRQAVVAHDLTDKEQTHVRAALAYLRVKLGGWESLAKVLHFEASSIIHVVARRRSASPTMAFRVARMAKVSIDDLLAGRFPPAGTCSHCGRNKENP